jgi:hypothetical protein
MTERLRCCVPFCNRSQKRGKHTEWICGKHWSVVPRNYRALYTKVKRRLKKNPDDERRWNQADRVWEACKRKAIELAAGI